MDNPEEGKRLAKNFKLRVINEGVDDDGSRYQEVAVPGIYRMEIGILNLPDFHHGAKIKDAGHTEEGSRLLRLIGSGEEIRRTKASILASVKYCLIALTQLPDRSLYKKPVTDEQFAEILARLRKDYEKYREELRKLGK